MTPGSSAAGLGVVGEQSFNPPFHLAPCFARDFYPRNRAVPCCPPRIVLRCGSDLVASRPDAGALLAGNFVGSKRSDVLIDRPPVLSSGDF
jgi:hypothetical protein